MIMGLNLFDVFERTYRGRANHDHSSYDFINNSAWQAAVYVRQLLNEWSREFPLDADFISRFKSDNYQTHSAAFFEIATYQWLRLQGFEIALHQIASTGSKKRPDFCIIKSEEKVFYAECTLSALPDHDPGLERLKNQITDVLESIPSPKYWLSVDFEKCSTASLAKKKIKTFVSRLIDEGLDEHDSHDRKQKKWTLNESGWQISFSLFPKSIETTRTLGAIHVGPAGIIYSEKPLRSSLDRKKGSNYGNLDIPYIVCINSADFYLDSLSVMQTFFGPRSRENGFLSLDAENDAFFLYKGRPRNTSVSRVLIVNNLVPWNLHVAKAALWHNPFAAFPLDGTLLDIHQIIFRNRGDNNFQKEEIKGRLIGDVLQIDSNYMTTDVE